MADKENLLVKHAGKMRREAEIAEHGKQIWLRKGGEHHSPKDYKRDHSHHYVDDEGNEYKL